MQVFWIFLVVILGHSTLLSDVCWAKEFLYLGRSPKGLLMGDAFTTLSTDDFTLLYNPATLGRNTTVSIYTLNPDFAVSYVLNDMDRFKNFPKDAPGIANRILDYPIHLHAGVTPGIKVGPFGFSYLVNMTTNVILQNAIHPVMDVNYRFDRGFIFGYAYNWGKAKPLKKKGKRLVGGSGWRSSIGMSIKSIYRESLNRKLHLFGTELLNIIATGNQDLSSIKSQLGVSSGRGTNLDLGYEGSYATSGSLLTFGFSILDVGDTKFKRDKGVEDIDPQLMNMQMGISYKRDFGIFDYTLSLDIHPLNQKMDFLTKVHAGVELSLPIISFMAGWNGGYGSYGVGIDLWAFKLIAGVYSTEIGEYYRHKSSKRALVYLNLLNLSFDEPRLRDL